MKSIIIQYLCNMPSATTLFYKSNPKAKKKKDKYNKEYHSTPERKAYKRELSRINRANGGWKDGLDVSHKKDGTTTKESPSSNRARNGSKKGSPKSSKRAGTKK